MDSVIPVIPAARAKIDLYKLLEEVAEKLKHVRISWKGKSAAVLIPSGEYQAWIETMDILKDKKLMKDLRQANLEIKNGKRIPEDQAKKILGW